MDTVKLHSLNLTEARTYLFASLFIVGNIVLPQLFHLLPNGGHTFLPIYFFTLIGAYKYGMKVGLLTAVLSPVLNALLFGMPAVAALPVLVVKSSLLAIAAALVAKKTNRVSLLLMLAVVVSYQVAGGAFEWAYTGSFSAAIQDMRVGVPGLLLQIIGGTLLLKSLKF